MEIVRRLITKNFTVGRSGQQITRITLHTAVSSADSLFGWFNGNAKASTHYYVNGMGKVEQYVDHANTAWANANGDSNRHSVTIEHWDNGNANNVERTPYMYENASQLLAKLSKELNIPLNLVSQGESKNWAIKGVDLHKYYANKSCPAGLDVNRLLNRAREILNINGNQMSESIKVNGATFTREDCFRIGRNLKGVDDASYEGEWTKWKANPVQGIIDLLNWHTYKNETCKQKDALQVELNTLKGILNAKDSEISGLTASKNDLTSRVETLLLENQDLNVKNHAINAEFIDFENNSKAEKEGLEAVIKQNESAISVLTDNNKRLQEQLVACQSGDELGQGEAWVLVVVKKFVEFLRNIFRKKS